MNNLETFFRSVNWRPSPKEKSEAVAFFSDERKLIREKFTDLHWSKPIEKQQEAICFLADEMKPGEYIHLIVPYNSTLQALCGKDKGIWENAANIILKLGWPKVDSIIIPSFLWLLDAVWPGSSTIYDFLLTVPSDVLAEKMKQIKQNKSCYSSDDYRDLMDIFQDICEDKQLRLDD